MIARILFLVLAQIFSLPAQAVFTDDDFIRQVAALRQRAIQAVDASYPDTLYMQAKADAWLDFAFEEHIEIDTTGAAEDALQRASQLVDWLEARLPEGAFPYPIPPPMGEGSIYLSPSGGKIDRGLKVIRETIRVREGLWSAIASARQNQHGYRCAAACLGRAEVQLIRAGHEQAELGIRHARRYTDEAEQLFREAERLAENCPQEKTATPAIPVTITEPDTLLRPLDSNDATIRTDREAQDVDLQPGEKNVPAP